MSQHQDAHLKLPAKAIESTLKSYRNDDVCRYALDSYANLPRRVIVAGRHSYSNIISSSDEAEEYVTNFYNQKRIEKRALAAQAVGMEADNISCEEDDHSLDHYFDHHSGLQSGQSGGYGSGDVKSRRRAFFHRSDIHVGSKDVSHELNDKDDESAKGNIKASLSTQH